MIAERFNLMHTGAISNLAHAPHFLGIRTNIISGGNGTVHLAVRAVGARAVVGRHANLQLRLEF